MSMPWWRAWPRMLLANRRSSHNSRAVGEASMSDRLRAALAGADADAILQGEDEDLAVANTPLRAGAGGLHDGVDGRLDEVLVDRDLELHLLQELHGQFVA